MVHDLKLIQVMFVAGKTAENNLMDSNLSTELKSEFSVLYFFFLLKK